MVRKLTMLPYEFVVRGYLFGSMWRAYDAENLFAALFFQKDTGWLKSWNSRS